MRLVRRLQSIPPVPPEAAAQLNQVPDGLRVPEKVVQRVSGEDSHSAKTVVSARLLVALQKPAEVKSEDPLLDLILDELPELADNLNNPDVRVRLATMNVLEMLGGDAFRASRLLVGA